MKGMFILISLGLLLCFTIGCQQNETDSEKATRVIHETDSEKATRVIHETDSEKATRVIHDAFMLEKDDNLEMIEFSQESQETAIAEFVLNGNLLDARLYKSETGWILSEIQDLEGIWFPVEYCFRIEGTVVDTSGKAIANEWVELYPTGTTEKGILTAELRIEGGVVLNPTDKTNSQGNFTIIADRRIWEESSGAFTLKISYRNKRDYLRDLDGSFVNFRANKNEKKVDLGEIRVSP